MQPARWFHLQQGQQRGPMVLDQVRELVLAGTVGPDTYVWADGMPEWMPASRVPALVPPPDMAPAGWPDPPPGEDAPGDALGDTPGDVPG